MQAFIFMVCVLCGAVSGIAYDALYACRIFVCGKNFSLYTAGDKIFTFVCDVIYFAVFTAMFIFTAVCFEFYPLRLYMLAGCAIGAILYLKSLHIIIAFLIKKVYNTLCKVLRSRFCRNERRKTQQNSGGDNG